MNTADLKERAKISFQKQYWQSVLVALIIALGGGGGYSFGYRFSQTRSGGYDSIYSNPAYSAKAFFIFFLIMISVLIFGAISFFLLSVLRVGGLRFFLKLRKNVPTDVGEVAGNFKDGNYWNIVLISFCKQFFLFLWYFLLIIPGIIKFFEYFAIDYILAVRPDLDRTSAFKMSRNLMDGHKMDCFVLGLTFLGWDLLNLLTVGLLGLFYISPYKQATYAEFFAEVRLDALRNGFITEADLPDYAVQQNNNYYNNYYNNLPHAVDHTFYGDQNNGFGAAPQQGPNGFSVNQPPYYGSTPQETPPQPDYYSGGSEQPQVPPQPENNGESEAPQETPPQPESMQESPQPESEPPKESSTPADSTQNEPNE